MNLALTLPFCQTAVLVAQLRFTKQTYNKNNSSAIAFIVINYLIINYLLLFLDVIKQYLCYARTQGHTTKNDVSS